ncbi:MAG: hypothetical protein Q8P67_16660 [archaeon]|nr:hypothetical protein [archaeon]
MAATNDDDSMSDGGARDLTAFRNHSSPIGSAAGAGGLGFDLDDIMSTIAPPPVSASSNKPLSDRSPKKQRGMFACLGGSKPDASGAHGDDWSDSESDSDIPSRSSSGTSKQGDNAFSLRRAFPLPAILANAEARRYFKVYASKEYSLENLLAWEMFAAFQEETNPQKRVETFFAIADTFFSTASPQHVNIIHPTTDQLTGLKRRLEVPATQGPALDECDDMISASRKLLEDTNMHDIWLRFTRSPDFEEMSRTIHLATD